jgi:hypothetical protein
MGQLRAVEYLVEAWSIVSVKSTNVPGTYSYVHPPSRTSQTLLVKTAARLSLHSDCHTVLMIYYQTSVSTFKCISSVNTQGLDEVVQLYDSGESCNRDRSFFVRPVLPACGSGRAYCHYHDYPVSLLHTNPIRQIYTTLLN